MDTLGIKITDGTISIQGIKIIRDETHMSISDIKKIVSLNLFVYECDAVDENGLALIIRLYNKLVDNGISCELYEHGRTSSIKFFNNLSHMYSEIDNDIDEFIDNEANDDFV